MTLVSSHLVGGLVMGCLALLLGIGLVLGALQRRRMRFQNAPTYVATGGVIYTVFQFGCAGLLIAAGAFILALMLLSRA
jgi:Ca2+/H+ antiporter